MNWHAFAWAAIGWLIALSLREFVGKLSIGMYLLIIVMWPIWLLVVMVAVSGIAIYEFLKWEV